MTDAPVRRRRRWPLIVAAGLVLAILFGAWQLQSEKLATTVLGRLGPSLGLELTFDGTPEYALRPEPRLVLPGFEARQPGAKTPLLTAGRLEISLPWATLTGDEGAARVITRVELDAPVLDLAALAAWQATRPETPFEVPTLTEGLQVTDGTVVGDGWRFTGVALALDHLAPGAPAHAEVAGRFERGTLAIDIADGDIELDEAGLVSETRMELEGTFASGDGDPMPVTLALAGRVDASGDGFRLDHPFVRINGKVDAGEKTAAWQLVGNVDLHVADVTTARIVDGVFGGDDPLPDLRFDGHVRLDDALRVDLGGAMARWPGGWPALPPPLASDAPLSFVLGYAGVADFSSPVRLRAWRRGGTALDVRVVVPEVFAWMDRDDASPLPPVEGRFETPTMTVGAFTLDGIRVAFDDGDGVDAAGPFANVGGSVDSSEPPAPVAVDAAGDGTTRRDEAARGADAPSR